ncbi:MAG: DUF1028 domain-containing protein [Alphaproteobacteria bacterium]|nr:DUF1028 domain-containing protein [Alphaproteobacteria bacterium]MBM4438207.1 DUF1028 domain-containing protein [Actinomycetota bacterium]
MTFSIIARCERTGMFGIGIATRPMAIGAKCPFLRAGIGGLVVQANGDPRLGPLGLRLLEMGYSAEKVLAEIASSDGADNMTWRQIAVVDKDGRAAVHTGSNNEAWAGHVVGKGFVALGNRLTSERTATAMGQAYEKSAGEELAERLVRALEAGRDAGGQVAGQHSAALQVVNKKSYAWVDLRADEHDEPIDELRRLYALYIPLIPYYDTRPSNPSMPRDDDWRKQTGVKGGPR